MRRGTLLVTMLMTVTGMVAAAPASAHRSPANCNANEFDANLIRDRYNVKPGETINYTVTVDNLGSTFAVPCDVTNLTLLLQRPGADGRPSSVFETVVASATFLSGSPTQGFGPFAYTVNSPGVTNFVARISQANGVLHDGDNHNVVNIDKTIGSDQPVPRIEVDKVANIRAGQAPQTVTYSYSVYNRTVPPKSLRDVTLSDNLCPGVTRPTPNGDTDADGELDPAEVWLYTCTMPHQAGVFTNVAEACGVLYIDSGPLPKVCDTDEETVQFTSPPPAVPQGGVLPTTAAQGPCTLSTPSGLRVRAGQLNTIRVRVREVDAGSTVTITLPGGKKATAKTNASGTAILRVRPTRSGRATIRIAECAEVERLTVRPSRRVIAQRNPRVTG